MRKVYLRAYGTRAADVWGSEVPLNSRAVMYKERSCQSQAEAER